MLLWNELETDDRDKIISKIKEGDIVDGTVKNLNRVGSVYRFKWGRCTLLHITDISVGSRINKPSELLSIGQSIKAKGNTKIDPKELKK